MLMLALVIAAGVTAASAADSKSLRGATVSSNYAYGHMEADIRKEEELLASFIQDLPAVIENAKSSLSNANLEYTGGNPMLTYQNFIVVKKYSNAQCHGEGTLGYDCIGCVKFTCPETLLPQCHHWSA
jgi:hypothetical protein